MTNRPRAYSYLRFSTTEQMKGDSLRRQLALARDYASRHDLELDEDLTFQDLGVSAFRGKNVTEGALGAFLAAVDAGHVPPGSWLLVENHDRLSRDKPSLALAQFQAILAKDITVVTLHDGHIYTREGMDDNPLDFIMSILTMFRAHDESSVKSKRLLAAWDAKRADAQAGKAKLTARCPAWLRLDKASGQFKPIKARVKVVRQIFEWSLAGLGKGVIAKRLNSASVATLSGRDNTWAPSAVQGILDSEAVLGTFTSRRRPDDPHIPGYYPAVIDRAVFLQVRDIRQAKRLGGGAKGDTFSNLFTGMVECGLCGSPMHHVSKGRGRVYLICSNAKWGNGCKYVGWRYAAAEYFILHALQVVEFSSLFPKFTDTAQAAITALEHEVLIARDALDKNIRDRETGVRLRYEDPDSVTIAEHLRGLEGNKASLEKAWDSAGRRLEDARAALGAASARHTECLTALEEWLAGDGADDAAQAFERRSQLHQLLRREIDCITFTSPPVMGAHHGDIRVVFQGEPEYQPIIRVSKDQRSAVADGVLELTAE